VIFDWHKGRSPHLGFHFENAQARLRARLIARGAYPPTQWETEMGESLYKIVRSFFNEARRKRTITKGLTLEEAQAHCRNPETSSKTATSAKMRRYTKAHGPWFDGYDRM
jgi:hypothetical protein